MANHPIFAPAFHGDVSAVKKLLDSDRTLVEVRDAKNLTPLHVAASRGKEKVIQLLLDYGADIGGPSNEDQWTPVVFASYRGHLEAVAVLIDNGAGITEADGDPIHFAGQRRHKDICRLLVDHGAVDDLVSDGDKKDEEIVGLFRAVSSYDSDTVERVLESRPGLANCRDRNGRTPLHHACCYGDTKSARVLLRNGADPSLKDDRDETPMERARAHRQHAVVKLLEKIEGSS